MSDTCNLRKTTYRLYPTPKQAVALDALLRSHQQLYNAALEERISAWTKAKLSISYEDQCKSLTVLRNDLPEWANIANCSSQQMTLRRLNKSFDAFFRRVKARQTPGFPRSNRRKKAVAKLSQAKSKTARRRLNWLHHTSAQLADQFALVATEELNIKNMTRSASGTEEKPGKNVAQKAALNREILDTTPALFTSLIRYKVQETGGEWLEAPTRKLKPSQRCPHCWNVQKKQLSQRTHECATCGHTEPRDIASDRVVLRWALESEADGREPSQYGGHFACRETPSFAQHRVG